MAPSPLLVRMPALASPLLLSPRRCLPAMAAAAASVRAAPALTASAPFSRLRSRCWFSASAVREEYSSTPIDIIVVLGGSGFVGSAICKAAVSKGIEVVSLSRWDEVLVGATAVVSTLGGFGNEEQMKRINGEANIVAVNAAKEYGVVLRPGFIYGKRKVNGFEIPLDTIGQPLEKLLSSVENFTKPLSSLPASDLILAPPVSVDDVAYAVVNAVVDDSFFGVFTIEQIKEAAAKVRVS
nr:unnamed protein product [Digitaria exilis]